MLIVHFRFSCNLTSISSCSFLLCSVVWELFEVILAISSSELSSLNGITLGCSMKQYVAISTFTWLPCFRDQSVDDYNFYHAIGSKPSQWEKSLNSLVPSDWWSTSYNFQVFTEFYTRPSTKERYLVWLVLALSSFAGTRILIVNIPKVYKRGTDKRSVPIVT